MDGVQELSLNVAQPAGKCLFMLAVFMVKLYLHSSIRIHGVALNFNFFLICIVGGWSPNWVHLARRPLTGLLYLPRVIVRMENLVEWMSGETKVLGENLPRRHFVHHKSHLTRPGIEPGPPRREASD
jgi:hypothetical protein